jgi:hypothetical protein
MKAFVSIQIHFPLSSVILILVQIDNFNNSLHLCKTKLKVEFSV